MPRGSRRAALEKAAFENQRNINQWTQLENERNIKQWNQLEEFKKTKAEEARVAEEARLAEEARVAEKARLAEESRLAGEERAKAFNLVYAKEKQEYLVKKAAYDARQAEKMRQREIALARIETMKQRKKTNFMNFLESNAYYLSGHGADSIETFTVPPKCLIFVKAQVGEETYPTAYARKLCHPYLQAIVSKPLLHGIPLIINEFGSLMLYEPGDQCPNFRYVLENCYSLPQEKGNNKFQCLNFDSGLLDITKIKCDASTFYFKQNLPIEASDDDIKQYVERLYINSVYPTIETVRSEIANLFSNESANRHFFDGIQGDKSSSNKINYLLSKLKSTKTTQRELCEQKPGIFYNFICRNIPLLGSKVYNKPEVPVEGAKMYPRGREEVDDPNARKILNQRIGESVARAKLLNQYYTGPYYKATKKYSFEKNKENYKLPVRPVVPQKKYNIVPGVIKRRPLSKQPNAKYEEKVYKRPDWLKYVPIPSSTLRRARPKHWNVGGGRRTRKIRLNKQGNT